MSWPIYSLKSKCIKCGGKNITVSYHGENDRCYYPLSVCYFVEKEHMLRHCVTCHFEWLETPLKEGLK